VKISVITVVKNDSAGIRETLQSVADQTGCEIEHVIIDGGSSDDTLEVIRCWSSRAVTFISEADSGPYDAMNKGVRAASGEIIATLNAGDVYSSTTSLLQLTEPFVVQPDLSATFGDLAITSSAPDYRELRRYQTSSWKPIDLLWGSAPPHPTLCLRRRAYDQVGLYDKSYRIAGDYDLCLRLFLNENLRYQYCPGIHVHMPTGGISNRGLMSSIDSTWEMYRACRSNRLPTSVWRLLTRLPRKWWSGRASGGQ
jgi:glycosyltransferase involved in cell wall biosynthesis